MAFIWRTVVDLVWGGAKKNTDDFPWPESPFKAERMEEVDPSNMWTFDGKVTNVSVNHGLIDGEVYFSFDNLIDITRTEVGDKVHVVAKRHHKEGGWFATGVSIVEKTWDDGVDEPDLEKTSIVGKVTSVSQDKAEINGSIVFYQDATQNYLPVVGDWVTAELGESDKDEDKNVNNSNNTAENDKNNDGFDSDLSTSEKVATSVEPLRKITIQGEITALLDDHGYIDKNIFFFDFACMHNYRPKRRDRVTVTAIESDQRGCSWRALSVVPCSANGCKQGMPKGLFGSNRPSQEAFLVQGQRPKRSSNMRFLPRKLPPFPVPEKLREQVMSNEELTILYPVLAQEMTPANFVHKFSLLLHLEEIQEDLNMEEFDMFNVCLGKVGPYLSLAVPGLCEGRPSVLIGDQIILSDPTNSSGPKYEGFVHEVLRDGVYLKFNDTFQSAYRGEDYNVSFSLNRTTTRRCHQAVKEALDHLGSAVLFPKSLRLTVPQIDVDGLRQGSRAQSGLARGVQANRGHANIGRGFAPMGRGYTQNGRGLKQMGRGRGFMPNGHPSPGLSNNGSFGQDSERADSACPISLEIRDGIKYFNKKLNDEQKMAVTQILLGQCRPLPYVIFGPPGTGKTITMVEAMLQVWKNCPFSRIIACTSSNSAADLLVERIHASGLVKTSDMIRVNAFQRQQSAISEVVLKYSVKGEDQELIARYRIVVCTCSMAGWLFQLGIRPGHFTHAMVDECGQATEPECLIPLGLVGAADGQIVLAGDPKQLGPVLMSRLAKMYGMELSFLERIMSCAPYIRDPASFSAHGGFDPSLVTMLVKNYRSHPDILHLSSDLFYFGELQPVADAALINEFCQWDKLPAVNFPIVFHGCRGEDLKETNSPSWYNAVETVAIVQYLQSLYSQPGITGDDIGIITPYRKQVEKIRQLLEKIGMEVPKVGSVEEFQGQERKIIIISTVRSNESLIGFDKRHTLGFLSNPKRFNVAITRAQALLIVVGNPHILAQDEYWRQLIKFCVKREGYTGCDLPDLEEKKNSESEKATNSEKTSDPESLAENSH